MQRFISLKKIILVGLVFSFVALLSLTQVYDSDDFRNYSRLYPEQQEAVLSEKCDQETTITYYYYDSSVEPFVVNNKVGIYIYAENEKFFELANELVNSGGGDWGYVYIPYNVKDRDYPKWRRVFSQLNELHLIPVIQLHDVNLEEYESQTKDAAEFLNSFLWPIKHKYISVYNEPNDSRFWYGEVDPAEYARILNLTIDTFRRENSDFFLLNGALNTSAPTDNNHLDAFEYLRLMNREVPGLFDKLDGWASHPYPQPNFSGSPYATGRWSIRAYEDELAFLKNELGVNKELPVFITETGWAHAEGKEYNNSFLSASKISEYFEIAYEEVWLPDARVVAVMPFTIKYEAPFDHFSWVNEDNVPYTHFDHIKTMKKVRGSPQALKRTELSGVNCQ